MNDKKDPDMKDVAATATKLFKEVSVVVCNLFNDLKAKYMNKPVQNSCQSKPTDTPADAEKKEPVVEQKPVEKTPETYTEQSSDKDKDVK